MRNRFMIGLGVLLFMIGCGSDQPDVKNRVPTVQSQLEAARQSAQDAKDAANKAAQAQKDIQAAVDKLNAQQRDSDGNLKEDRPQQTGAGVIVDIFTMQVPADANYGISDDAYLGFTFAERSGFTKRFFPVCPGQTIQAYKPIILMYHWRHDGGTASGKRGCYIIDGVLAGQ
jgi:hypothetical protein